MTEVRGGRVRERPLCFLIASGRVNTVNGMNMFFQIADPLFEEVRAGVEDALRQALGARRRKSKLFQLRDARIRPRGLPRDISYGDRVRVLHPSFAVDSNTVLHPHRRPPPAGR